VAEFIDLYAEGGVSALPPLEVVADQEGNVVLCDGHHRYAALVHLGVEEAPAFVIEVPPEHDLVQVAFERAVTISATSAKPLSRAERRAAVVRLLRADPSRSDREVARVAGMSPTTVGRIRREVASPSGRAAPETEVGDWYAATASAKELARRAFRALERVRQTKGFGIADRILGDRTSERFARVLTDEFGKEAMNRAIEYRTWIDGAIEHLEEVGQT
jgi:ParB-like chromosome segregation protein Spo0J